MDLILSDGDVQTLRGLLRDYLPELKFRPRGETARFRHLLYARQTLCEQLLDRLTGASSHEESHGTDVAR